MPVAKPPPPGLTWSLELPDRLKLAIADAVTLYARLESLCIECLWEIENADFERRRELAKNWGEKNFVLVKKAVANLPGAKTERIWPTLRWLGKERNVIAHSVWLWSPSEQRPMVVWHSKFLETDEWVGAEFYDWERFERFDKRVKALVNLFNDFKALLVKGADEARAKGIVLTPTTRTKKPWRPDRHHLEIAGGALLLAVGFAAGWLLRSIALGGQLGLLGGW
jgi:hypothetical protein